MRRSLLKHDVDDVKELLVLASRNLEDEILNQILVKVHYEASRLFSVYDETQGVECLVDEDWQDALFLADDLQKRLEYLGGTVSS